jgi:hypothetical protein
MVFDLIVTAYYEVDDWLNVPFKPILRKAIEHWGN